MSCEKIHPYSKIDREIWSHSRSKIRIPILPYKVCMLEKKFT